jgi:NitT/TauT family transport system permease protein
VAIVSGAEPGVQRAEERPVGHEPLTVSTVAAEEVLKEAADGSEHRWRDGLVSLGVLVAFLGAWTLASSAKLVSPIVLPPPATIGAEIVDVVRQPWFPGDVLATASETVIGFGLAAVVGILLGVVLSAFDRLRRVVYPYIVVFQVIPSVALAPVLIIWLGPGLPSKIGLAFTISFFVVLVNTMEGMDRVPANSRRLMASMAASRRQTFVMLAVPAALPYVFAGLRTAATLALVGALVGEFITSSVGMGRRLVEYSFAMKADSVWALLVLIGALGMVLYGMVTFIDRRVVWWRA